jgi:hypothetical protein
MIVLDTDHFSVLLRPSRARDALRKRLLASPDSEKVVAIVAVEEAFRGWLAKIRSSNSFRKQIDAYTRLHELLAILARWRVLSVSNSTVDHFERLKKDGVRIGT